MMIADHPSIWRCSSAEYHAETDHLSSTSLGVFLASRALYHGQYIAKTMARPEPSEAMQLGSALHVQLLELNRWGDLVAVAPNVDRRTKAGRAAWADFIDNSRGKIVITPEQDEKVQRMVDGLFANSFAADLLEAPGENELGIRFQIDGVKVKARLDRLLAAGMIIDLKTSRDPSPSSFSRTAYELGYHRAAWLYRSAAEVLGFERPEFLHIVIGSEEPFECFVYELDAKALELGEREVRQALADVRQCRESGDWSSPLDNRINPISLPKYAFSERTS